jgi:thymidylate synthase ThyX
MTQVNAKVIADSKNEFGNRITTMVVTFPRIILAELNTHRMLSKNSASSRAIPFEKMVKSVEENPFIPIAWQKDHKGMQGTEYIIDKDELYLVEGNWKLSKDRAVEQAIRLSNAGLTKQLCNRLLEPFMWHTVIVTATEWENFFALRCPQYQFEGTNKIFRSVKDANKAYPENSILNAADNDLMLWRNINKGMAEIHMMQLAECMWDALNESTPKQLQAGEWHIPFGDNFDDIKLKEQVLNIWNQDKQRVLAHAARMEYIREDEINYYQIRQKIATARCAGVSYTVVGEDGKEASYEKLIARHDMLLKSGHWSPFEHCAKAMNEEEYQSYYSGKGANESHIGRIENLGWSGNFRGFIQYRKMFNNENITK